METIQKAADVVLISFAIFCDKHVSPIMHTDTKCPACAELVLKNFIFERVCDLLHIAVDKIDENIPEFSSQLKVIETLTACAKGKELQAELTLANKKVELMARYFVQYLGCVPCPLDDCGVEKGSLDDCLSNFQQYFTAKAEKALKKINDRKRKIN